MSTRYAIYFAPAKESPWWTFGAHWLGRNEFDDTPLAALKTLKMTLDAWTDVTAEPRHYGFHATLKAPFRLRDGGSFHDLVERMQTLAAKLAPVPLGSLEVLSLGNFVALVPKHTPANLQSLADTCVMDLDDLRAPLSEQDLARRQVRRLDAREMVLLHQYGYPYVLERFRFHFTLTGSVVQPTQQRVVQEVRAQVSHMNTVAPLVLDRLCLFMEPRLGASFKRVADVVLSP